jgi:dolichyl-phosphate beta-glucosyltransferase
MLNASKSIVLFSDADLSTPIEEMEKLYNTIQSGDAQVAIGSRAIHGARIEVSQPLYRIAMGNVFRMLTRLIALEGIHDTQCGFKMFSLEATKAIFRRQQLSGFGFDVEVLAIARQLGYKIEEFPVRWINSAESKVNAWHHSLEMFLDLIRIRWNIIRGYYR